MIEIERKFLLQRTDFLAQYPSVYLKQAYLNSDKDRTVRIRQQDQKAWITIKSKTTGISRQEFEYEIPTDDANELFKLCETIAIEKNRYLIKIDQHTWEVDEFLGANKGLFIAEIELNDEQDSFSKPDWLGTEVSGDQRYYNSALSKKPYTSW